MDRLSTIKAIARDTLLIFVLAVLGLTVGAVAAGSSANLMRRGITTFASIVLFAGIGFITSGYQTPRRRWVHLLRVTVCVWLVICGVLLSMAHVDVVRPGIPIGVFVLCGVFLLVATGVAMGIGGAISFALRQDPGDPPMDTVPAELPGPQSGSGTSKTYGSNWVKVAVVLSSTPFFYASCTAIMGASIPALKHIGGKDMARGDAPNPLLMVIASIPNPTTPGKRMVDRVTLGSLPEFRRKHPDHSFVIPARSGEISRDGASTSYRATALGADEVRVETDTRYDDPFGLSVVGSYEASEREVRPIHTNATVVFENLLVGVAGACILALIGSILKGQEWIGSYEGHQIRVTNSWTRGAKLYVDDVLRAETRSLFVNPCRPVFSATLSEVKFEPRIDVFFRGTVSVRIDGKKVAGDLA